MGVECCARAVRTACECAVTLAGSAGDVANHSARNSSTTGLADNDDALAFTNRFADVSNAVADTCHATDGGRHTCGNAEVRSGALEVFDRTIAGAEIGRRGEKR